LWAQDHRSSAPLIRAWYNIIDKLKDITYQTDNLLTIFFKNYILILKLLLNLQCTAVLYGIYSGIIIIVTFVYRKRVLSLSWSLVALAGTVKDTHDTHVLYVYTNRVILNHGN